MSTSFFGKNGFIWWKGVVEDRKDPIFLGRVRVRIFGWHTEDKTQLPTEDLPWALPSLPPDNGRNPVGPKEGDWCWGFFLDDSDAQKPVVVGYMPGIDEDPARPDVGFYDPTPDDQLTSENVPRPPRMSPLANYEPEFLEVGADGFSSEFLPEDNVAFGQLTSEYSADNYKFDLNKDGSYDAQDVEQMLGQEDIFTGEIKTTVEQQTSEISRYPLEDSLNEPSTSRLARNENITQTIVALKTSTITSGEGAGFEGNALGAQEQPAFPFSEPQTPYAAKYPYNHVYESESGHVIEVDDSPGAERLHWYHRSGSFKEIHPSGLEVNKSVNHQYNFVYLDHYCGVGYNYNLDANQSVRMQSGQVFNIKSGSDHNRQVGGSLNASVSASANTKIGSARNVSVGQNSNELVGESKNTLSKNIHEKAETIHLYGTNEVVITSATRIQIFAPIVEIIGDTTVTGSLSVTGEAKLLANMAKSVLLPLPITTSYTSPPASVPAINEAELLDETLKDLMTTADGSPKYGYLIPNGVTGDVWKPISDSNGNLVVLSSLGGSHELREALPTAQLEAVLIKHQSVSGKITEWEVVRPIHVPGDLIDSPVSTDQFEDGVRILARFSKPGAEYPKQLFWMNNGVPILILNSGYRHQCTVPYDNVVDFDLSTTIETNNNQTNTEEL
jgi:hypothetical protein